MTRQGTFHQLYLHFVWTTRNREPLLIPEVETLVYASIGASCKKWGYTLYATNGTLDHVHALVEITPSHLIADVARNLKGSASHLVNAQANQFNHLYWQDGYGVLSIRKSDMPTVARYIQRQKSHHQSGTLSELLECCTTS